MPIVIAVDLLLGAVIRLLRGNRYKYWEHWDLHALVPWLKLKRAGNMFRQKAVTIS